MSVQTPLTPIRDITLLTSKTFGSSVAGVENGSVVQPSVLSVDIQSPLPGDTDPFSRNNNEGEDKALQATFHVYTGKDCADL